MMNFKVLLATVGVVAFSFFSCSLNKITEPEQIGRQVFEILKNTTNNSNEDYISNFLSFEEYRETVENEEADTRNKITSMKEEEFNEKFIDENVSRRNIIKSDAVKYGIVWNEIEYVDFAYKLGKVKELPGCSGTLYFKINHKKYGYKSFRVSVSSVFNGTEYRLSKISWLRYERGVN